MDNPPVKVLFIVGAGRTGSTLLSRMLGQLSSYCNVGELKAIWRMGFVLNRPCGCTEHFTDCPFWSAVVREAFGSLENVDVAHLGELFHSVGHFRTLPQKFLPDPLSDYQERLEEYSKVLGNLYQSIGEVANARVVVDSSKSPVNGLVLNSLKGIQPYLVHLVRDSRAVAYSWRREKRGPSIKGWQPYILSHGPVKAAFGWNVTNGLSQMLRLYNSRYMRVRYEDFASDPKNTLRQLARYVGEDEPNLDFIQGNRITLDIDHTIAGNPMRFENGALEIRPDVEWMKSSSKNLRYLVTFLTWPLLSHYHYVGR
jgi:hypothetical protein